MEGMDRVTEASRSSGVTGHPLWAVIGIFHVCSHSIPSQSWEVDPAVIPPFTGEGGGGLEKVISSCIQPTPGRWTDVLQPRPSGRLCLAAHFQPGPEQTLSSLTSQTPISI